MTTTTQTRRLESKGIVVETSLTDSEALAILIELTDNGFAYSLARQYQTNGWTPAQHVWAHKIAMETVQSRSQPAREQLGDFEAIAALFIRAKAAGLKYPKIRFDFEDNPIHLVLAGEKSKAPGTINVTDGGSFHSGKWYGRINQDGSFSAGRDCPASIVAFLKRFAQDPAGLAASYGRESGCCCFCARKLEDERSVAVGYGPVCADKYSLPWGSSVKVAADLLSAN